ncbi:hypothetical protein QR680_012035 [Steinernema hermaphroditum]|uniref:Uncharacterized protein n=1 Tax=Steinernema hermaphroditum TaxID=289476 RepID=A0AA39I0N5_9BILA|nr:hypothetical protein QR680_012035 [Steinernema hermaphroditum]
MIDHHIIPVCGAMEFTPFAFINSVISLLSNSKDCQKLSSYWGRAEVAEGTTLEATIHDWEMSLKNTNPETMTAKVIRISTRAFGSANHSTNIVQVSPQNLANSVFFQRFQNRLRPDGRNRFISAISTPVITRLGQELVLENFTNRKDCVDIINAIDGNFKKIRIAGVHGFSVEIENLFLRILPHQLPADISMTDSDITSRTLSLIMNQTSKYGPSRFRFDGVNISDRQLTLSNVRYSKKISEVIDAIGMPFKKIKIGNVRGLSTQLKRFFIRVLPDPSLGHISVTNSDITQKTVSLLIEQCVKSKTSYIQFEGDVNESHLRKFFDHFHKAPYPVALHVLSPKLHLLQNEVLEMCGPGYYGQSANSLAHNSGQRFVHFGGGYFRFVGTL